MEERSVEFEVSAVQGEVRRLSHSQQVIDRFWASELGVDQHGWTTITSLMRHGPSTPTELARGLGISSAAMSLVLQRLEAKGHTTRDLHPTDRRKIVVSASEETVKRIYSLVSPVVLGLTAITTQLTPNERQSVANFLAQLNDLYLRCAGLEPREGEPST